MKSLHRIRATDFAKLLKTEGKHNDGGSLYLVVRGGSARFEYQYREGGKCKSHWLGSAVGYAPISLAQAREARVKAWLDRRGNGQQPRPARSVAAGKPFTETLEAWLAANPNAWAAKGIVARRSLASLSLGKMDIAKITQADVLAALANETPRQHMEKRGWLADLFSFAKVQGYRSGDNPARFDKDMTRGFAKIEKGNGHAHIAWQDFPAVFAALPDSEIGRAIRFTALTVARAGEIEGATWGEIVGENGLSAWVIPAERMKAGKAHRVPLTPQALALLGERGADDAPLFRLTSNAMLYAIKKVSPGATMHGLRATFKTWSDDNAKDRELTERSLAHIFGGRVENSYKRSDLFDRRRILMEEWSAFLKS